MKLATSALKTVNIFVKVLQHLIFLSNWPSLDISASVHKRSRVDWTDEVRELLEVRYPHVLKIKLVISLHAQT
ncbi:hypothetical protein [Paenibacillus peoriae]|uniref:hypothetical protein n=1 Tax=Paenibacillus peoriae TaxID=59893 RepID=UPI00096CE1DA|nr:hypothetical protein [Paenibacillus peoriae]OMF77884.1 hypothetical protein BK145_18220 [Paenibacillus peoriae]